MRRFHFSFALFALGVTAALPATAQTQQAAPIQTAALTVAPDLPKEAQSAPQVTPPGTIDVEPESDWIATHAPRSLHKF